MQWFKNLWLSSEERQNLKDAGRLREENEKLTDAVSLLVKREEERKEEVSTKPYKRLYYDNENITVVFNDGNVVIKSGIDNPAYLKIKSAWSEDEVRRILNPQVVKPVEPSAVTLETKEERISVLDNLGILRDNPEFEIKEDQVYLKGVSLAMPAVVISSFIEILEKIKADYLGIGDYEDQYHALRMFWLKLALNGIEQSRTDLLNFVRKNDVRITTNGNLVLYRRIVSISEGNKYHIEFISQQYAKIKGWKKSPDNYFVMEEEDGTYSLHSGKLRMMTDSFVGYLGQLYKDLPSYKDNEYTSAHNKGKHIIKVGQVYQIDEKGINLNNGLCAAGGLHAAAVNYDYSGFGDTPVVVLINPSKAITVPVNETGKLRTTEMFVAAINDKPHGVHFDEGALSAFDEEYNNISIQELEEAVKEKSFKPATVVEEVSPITFVDMTTIKDMLKNRIVKI